MFSETLNSIATRHFVFVLKLERTGYIHRTVFARFLNVWRYALDLYFVYGLNVTCSLTFLFPNERGESSLEM